MFPGVRSRLFEPFGRPGYSRLRVEVGEIKAAIFGHPEFTAFNASVTALFDAWRAETAPRMKAIAVGDHARALVEAWSESLLETFGEARLVDAYDVYQSLMDAWAESMQDDAYLVAAEGWRPELAPAALVVRRWFAPEQAAVERLEQARDAVTRQMEELDEEHAGEEGLFADARTDKGKLTRASVKGRLAEIKGDADDERAALERCLALVEDEAARGRKVKDAQKALDVAVKAKIPRLTAEEVKKLVVEDKWLAGLALEVQSELDRVSQALTGRVRELAEQYATPLPRLVSEVEVLSARVEEHLRKMGAVWK